MPDSSQMRLYGVLAFGAGGLAAGLVGLFASRIPYSVRRVGFAAVAILLVGLGFAGILLDDFTPLGGPVLALGGVLTVLPIIRSDRAARATAWLLSQVRQSRWQWSALAASCPVLAGFMLLGSHAPESGPAEQSPPVVLIPSLRMLPPSLALTDQGHDITLWKAMIESDSEEDLAAAEAYELKKDDLQTHVIRRAPPDRSSNCHGWVFTGIHCFIPDWTVDTIINENGYKMVEHPAAGDLVVYRNDTGVAIHTAVVRAVCDDGQVLLESKWGWMGRYLHPPDKTPYGQTWQYYRSQRNGHLLRMQSDLPLETLKRRGPRRP